MNQSIIDAFAAQSEQLRLSAEHTGTREMSTGTSVSSAKHTRPEYVKYLAAMVLLFSSVLACGPNSGPGTPGSTAVWRPESTRIEIESFGFWDGGWKFEADRAQLTAAQLQALEGLRTIPTPSQTCPSDIVGAEVTVYDGAAKRVLQVNQSDANCGDGDYLSYASYEPLKRELGCFGAGATRDLFPDDGDRPSVTLTPSAGCLHGVFGTPSGNRIHFKVKVEDVSRPLVFEIRDCYSDVSLHLLAPGGAELATAHGSAGAVCARFEHTFAAAGTYDLHIDKAASESAGDFYLRVAPKEG